MKGILTILRRDLAAYFTSPIGYIFMIVFLAISVGLYITSFFTFPVADMRPYFTNLPILLCVFIPAVTMRVWAEERKENTWEMLLTFPMSAFQLVLGKFLATLAFFAITIAATFTIPLMLVVLGNPDHGAMIGGYLGTLLLGAFFIAIGIFFSGFCRDQIVAFVVTLLACFAIFLLGTNFIASYIDGVIPGLGSVLSDLVGMMNHYGSFTRGIVEVADLLYFVVWTVLFLVLNILYIEGRNRRGVRTRFAIAVTLCVGIGLAFNWLLTGQSLYRFDMTEGNIYTVSPASAKILSAIDVPVQVKVYITPKNKMPTGLTNLEQDITDKLNDLKVESGGKLEFTAVHLEAANVLAEEPELPGQEEATKEGEDESKVIEKRMLEKGVKPFSVNAMAQDQFTQQLVYSSIGVAYREKKEEIIPQIVPDNLPELEYRIVNTVYKLTRKEPPVVALVAPREAFNINPQMRQLYMQMGQPIPQSEDPYVYLDQLLRYEKYSVERVDLTGDSKLPDKYDTLVVVNPRDLNDRQRWEINRALVSGKSVVLAVQNYEWDYQIQRDRINLSKRPENPGVNPLLEKYGLGVDPDILMDTNNVRLTVQSGGNDIASLLGMGQPVKLPMHILVNNSSMNQEAAVTNRLGSIFYLWGSALTLNQEQLDKYGLQAQVLMTSGGQAWKIPSDAPLTQASLEPPATGTQGFPIMVLVQGQFPDAYKDQPRPTWPPSQPMPGMPPKPPPEPEQGEAAPVTPAPGKLILMGCSEMFRKNFVTQGGNMDLFLNCVDTTTLGDEIVNIRGQKPIDRGIDIPKDSTRTLWKGINYALINLIIAVIGITVAATRKRSRDAYTIAYSRGEKA